MTEFYSSTINGVELKCKFAFPKNYFTKNISDATERMFYDVGFLDSIGWEDVNSSTPIFSLNTMHAMDIVSGISISRGEMILKIFHRESLEELKREIVKGINNGRDQIEFPVIEDNPFVVLGDIEESLIFDSHSDSEKINWSQMPLFDIILISQVRGEDGIKRLRKKEIKGVRFESIGFSESIESLEMNTMASFIAIGRITDWEAVDG